ncbi:proteasome inhibitor PI31 subunit-like [Diaphorina citri]|uniref:Proteasome inhibitor PI31 subunit n=1 Tax=Diaphorina citri TaxID=121845 RepID=A0A1S3DGC0_DIACI|nr:proteasome inhibitor PI31 subunit-like [Diaphorina citri]
MSFNTVGLEVHLKIARESIKKEDDALVVFIHWLLIKNEFLCIGLGENVDVPENAEKTEILPDGWSSRETYAIRYLDSSGKLFTLRGLKNDVNIIFNFVRAEDLNVTSVSFNSQQEVKSLSGPIATMFPKYCDIGNHIQNNLISPQQQELSKESSTQTKPAEPDRVNVCVLPQPRRDPLMIGGPNIPSRVDPFNYGRSDLDPLSGMGGSPGGGMLFDPFSQDRRSRIDPNAGLPGPGLPRGAIPPGARFDPFGPPDPESDFGLRGPDSRPRSGPRLPGTGSNPDMLPPGYDDMFM